MRRNRAEWEQIVAEFETSGEEHVAFCTRRRLSVHSFRNWLYRLRKERSKSGVPSRVTKSVQMIPVRIRQPAPEIVPTDDIVEVVVPGALVRAKVGQDAEYVATLAAALAARC